MNFCLNIENFNKNIIYRLKNDLTWKICKNPTEIAQNDFVTSDREAILKLQVSDEKIVINDTEYIINSTGGLTLSVTNNKLEYSVYIFRDNYPQLPEINQLKETLLNGDDSRGNSLVLKTDGKFYLLNPKEIFLKKQDPEIVYEHKRFIAKLGNVGKSIDNKKLDNYTNDIFNISMHYWRNHLKNKVIHIRLADLDDNERMEIDKLQDIYTELNKLKW